MYLANYHTHSRISPDSSTPMAKMAKAAVDMGLHEICFTDHVDIIPPAHGSLLPYHWRAMEQDFAQAQKKYGKQIQLRLGMELGEAALDFDQANALLQTRPDLDFVIASVHRLGAEFGYSDLLFCNPQTKDQGNQMIACYLDLVSQVVDWGQFSVLGHFTLPLRYFNQYRGLGYSFEPFRDQVADIFTRLIDKGLGIELNVNRGGLPLPHEPWLRLYHDLGGKRITIGSDAHSPEHLQTGLIQGQELLSFCGFTRFCTFEKMNEIYHPLL